MNSQKIGKIAFAFLFFTLLLSCTAISHVFQNQPAVTSGKDQKLARANYLAHLGNWLDARPLYAELEQEFQNAGDAKNALYAHISKLRGEEESSDLFALSSYLATELNDPLVAMMLACDFDAWK